MVESLKNIHSCLEEIICDSCGKGSLVVYNENTWITQYHYCNTLLDYNHLKEDACDQCDYNLTNKNETEIIIKCSCGNEVELTW